MVKLTEKDLIKKRILGLYTMLLLALLHLPFSFNYFTDDDNAAMTLPIYYNANAICTLYTITTIALVNSFFKKMHKHIYK